jgi:hypothetical protein
VARELAPARLRSDPNPGECAVPDKTHATDLGPLRAPARASSLATVFVAVSRKNNRCLIVARELAPAGLRSDPKPGECGLSDITHLIDFGPLRAPARASSLATDGVRSIKNSV